MKVSEVNDAPEKPAAGLTDPADPVLEDTSFAYVFSKFTDEEDDTDLTYVVKRVLVDQDGLESLEDLPDWIKLEAVVGDATKLQLTFKPRDSSDAGTYKVRVKATDKGIGNDDATKKSAQDDFEVVVVAVNDVPKKPVAGLADPDDVDEDTSSTYKFDAFTDEETSPLTYTFSVQRVVGNVKTDVSPKWITLVSATRTFTFTPTLRTHAGTYEVTVVATDAGIGGDAAAKKNTEKSAEDVFELVVSAVNDAPVASIVPEQKVDEDATVTYQVLPFTDEEDDTMSADFKYEAQLVLSGTPGALPSWITFVKATRTFTFTPKAAHVGSHTLRVTGTDDGGKSDFVEFDVKVAEVNDAPVASIVPEQEVDEDATVTYQVLPFKDEENDAAGTDLTYVAQLVVVDQNGVRASWIFLLVIGSSSTTTPPTTTPTIPSLRLFGLLRLLRRLLM